jgi:hypothetical protein
MSNHLGLIVVNIAFKRREAKRCTTSKQKGIDGVYL